MPISKYVSSSMKMHAPYSVLHHVIREFYASNPLFLGPIKNSYVFKVGLDPALSIGPATGAFKIIPFTTIQVSGSMILNGTAPSLPMGVRVNRWFTYEEAMTRWEAEAHANKKSFNYMIRHKTFRPAIDDTPLRWRVGHGLNALQFQLEPGAEWHLSRYAVGDALTLAIFGLWVETTENSQEHP